MQGTKIQNKCAGNKAGGTCISRSQRDTLCNIGCKLVFVRFFQSVNSTFCTVFAMIQTSDRVSISSEDHEERTVPKVHVLRQSLLSEHHPAVPQNDTQRITVLHSTRLCLSASASKPDFLSFRPRQEASQGVVDTTTVPPPEQREFVDCLFCTSSCPNRNFFQAQTYVDSFVIAVCCCLCFCCS